MNYAIWLVLLHQIHNLSTKITAVIQLLYFNYKILQSPIDISII